MPIYQTGYVQTVEVTFTVTNKQTLRKMRAEKTQLGEGSTLK